MLFWDYDTQWGMDALPPPASDRLGHLEFVHTERLLDIHAHYGIPACFAVVGAAALPGARPYHDPAQIRRIHAAGHEVASHSFRHEWLPALTRPALVETLRRSKESLQQCIGAPVISFVPPFNQPFDYPAGWSFSFSERRRVRTERTDLRRLCEVLHETGYGFCRVAYLPLHLRLVEHLLQRRRTNVSHLESIAGIPCIRMNGAAGFTGPALSALNRCATTGGIVAVYGHPHSLDSGNAQDELWLRPFLERVDQLRRRGRIQTCLPRELLGEV